MCYYRLCTVSFIKHYNLTFLVTIILREKTQYTTSMSQYAKQVPLKMPRKKEIIRG